MYKSVIAAALFCGLLNLVVAAPFQESGEIRKNLQNDFQRGLSVFGGKAEKAVENPDAVEADSGKPKIFSLYTNGLNAIGGGKPHLTSQYIKHSFVPPAPVVVPAEKKPLVSDKMSAAEAADRFKPEPAYQYTTDRLFQ